MTPKRDRSASRQAALTERLRAAGLVPVQVWVRPERRADVMALDERREIKQDDQPRGA